MATSLTTFLLASLIDIAIAMLFQCPHLQSNGDGRLRVDQDGVRDGCAPEPERRGITKMGEHHPLSLFFKRRVQIISIQRTSRNTEHCINIILTSLFPAESQQKVSKCSEPTRSIFFRKGQFLPQKDCEYCFPVSLPVPIYVSVGCTYAHAHERAHMHA